MTKNKHNFTLNNSSDGVNNNDDPSDHHDYSDDSMPPTPTISTFNKFPRQSSLRFKTLCQMIHHGRRLWVYIK